jgi:DNA-cytosine methyltransferase
MKILSLFDGISIAQQALKELNIPVEKYYASEIDKYAISITQHNFPDTIQLGSVTDINWNTPSETNKSIDIDLIIGGSPCQDLSIAKKNREGLKGSRSALFYEFVRLIKEVKPKHFVLENVASMPKEAKAIITMELFNIPPVMINAALVSAQNRKRLFWVGSLQDNGEYKQVEIQQPEDRGILLKDILESEVDEKYYVKGVEVKKQGKEVSKELDKAHSLMARDYKGFGNQAMTGVQRVGSLNSGGQGDRIYSPEGKSVNLSANGGGRGAKTGLYAVGCASRTYPRIKVEGQERSKQIEVRKDEKANSMTSVQGDSMVLEQSQIRKLTPIECERLMTVPDNFAAKGITEKGEVDISNTQRYKALGNGFSCEVVKHILKTIY